MLTNQDSSASKNPNVRCDLNGCGCKSSTMIWISHPLNAIYFETPKTASTSIKRALNIGVHNKPKFSTWFRTLARQQQRSESAPFFFEMWPGDGYSVINQYPSYFKFAITRNPWDKMVSNWIMFCKSGNKFRRKQIETLFGRCAEEIEFDEFIRKTTSIHNHHWQQNVDFIPHKNDTLLIDYIGRMESLSDDWREITRLLDAQVDLSTENTTRHSNFRSYYDEKLQNIVARTHQDDIRILKYKY